MRILAQQTSVHGCLVAQLPPHLPSLLTALPVITLLAGCLVVPVDGERSPLPSAGKSFSFVEVGQTDRSTITNRLGDFDEYYDDRRLGFYRLSSGTRAYRSLALGVIPVGKSKEHQLEEIAYFEFDTSDRVLRHAVVLGKGGRHGAEAWLGTEKR